MRRMLTAMGALLMAQAAGAAPIVAAGAFTAGNWVINSGPASPPIPSLYVRYVASFDTSQTYTRVTAPLQFLDTNVPYPLTFSYFANNSVFVLATNGGPLSCQLDPNSFCAFVKLTGGPPDFVGQAGTTGSWEARRITEGVGGVPEPASWAMLIAGFGLTGAIARRRRAMLA